MSNQQVKSIEYIQYELEYKLDSKKKINIIKNIQSNRLNVELSVNL